MASASPWKRTVQAPAVSMAALMDEQYAEKLQKQEAGPAPELHTEVATEVEAGEGEMDEELAFALALSLSEAPIPATAGPVPEQQHEPREEPEVVMEGAGSQEAVSQEGLDSDFALAMALQEAERRELDRVTQYIREHRGEKVQLSFQGFGSDDVETRRLLRGEADADMVDEDEEEEDDGIGLGIAMVKDGRRRKRGEMMRTRDGSVITKHDADLNARLNALDMTRQFERAGDMADGDFRIPNRVFNSLKSDLKRSETFKGMAARGRIEGSTRATQEGVLDSRTRLILFKMLNKGLFQEVGGCVKTGKESNLYFAPAGSKSSGVAIKVFKTTLNEFSKRSEYIDEDPRYSSLRFNKQSDREKFKLWAKKEMRNLIRIHRAGIPCPEPLEQKQHVLAMSFLGVDGWPSPQLREVKLSAKGWDSCYAQVVGLVRALFQRAGLVHGDLSEYNILWHQSRPFLIDFGQSVHFGHPKSNEFLRADVRNCDAFFKRMGVRTLAEEDVISFVTTAVHADEGDERTEEQLADEVLSCMLGGKTWEQATEEIGVVLSRSGLKGHDEEDEDEDEEEEDDDEEEGEQEGDREGLSTGEGQTA